MLIETINPNESGYFSKLILDYLNNDQAVQPLFHRFPTIENFKAQIEEKKQNYTAEDRKILVKAIAEQYVGKNKSEKTAINIDKLHLENTFTITTGHQLNLFTGPVYYIYKILSVINLSETLAAHYPEHHFVPVFWMATEDHDFEEINYFKFRDKKIKWSSPQKGPVGRFSTTGLDELATTIQTEFGKSTKATFLSNLFRDAYTKHTNLADATFYITNELFKEYGIVILNGDCKTLKSNFKNCVKQELLKNTLHSNITTQLESLKKYHLQVNPREINLFYIENGCRERIVFENNEFKVLNTEMRFSEKELLHLLEQEPEKFSPNAIFRPVYQEKVLPNLAYVGGGGELAYWLELKSSFASFKITYPILVHRDSVLLVTEKQDQKIKKLTLKYADLFKNEVELGNIIAQKNTANKIDFNALKTQLQKQFEILNQTATKTDKSFSNAVNAQQQKQFKGLENLEKKLLKAEKKIFNDKIARALTEKAVLFPNKNLQERSQNFSEFYLDTEQELVTALKKYINPLHLGFKVIVIR